MKLKKHEIYRIDWVDTYSCSGWHTEKKIDEETDVSLVKTVGFFIKENKDFIILCMEFLENRDFEPYNSPIWIPKGFIKKIRKLK